MYPNIPRNEGIDTMGEYLKSCSDKSISTNSLRSCKPYFGE